MPQKLAAHGSEAGYRQELETGPACDRCKIAHRNYQHQFSKRYKEAGKPRIPRDQVTAGSDTATARAMQASRPVPRPQRAPGGPDTDDDGWGDLGPVTVGARLTSALRSRLGSSNAPTSTEYVDSDEVPDYLQGDDVEKDPEPDGDWSRVTDEDIVINAQAIAMMKNNLGTYLSVLGITLDLIDPYCGSILANNLDRMVERWVKVITHYPKAAALFMDAKGGVIMDWIGALQVTWPFLYAIYEHHLARTVRVHDGVIERKVNDATGSTFRGFDATTPPGSNQQYEFTVG